MSVYSFITQPFRYAETADQAVRTAYSLARVVELEGRLTTLTDAAAVATTLFNILKAPRQRFEVTVLGVNVINLTAFGGSPPCAMLSSDRFDLSAGLLVLIPDFSINLDQGQTVLRCWG